MGGDYGYYGKRHRGGQGRGSVVLKAADIFFAVLTCLGTLALAAALLARYIDPRDSGLVAMAGLLFPMLYLAEAAFCLWWVLRWRWFAFVAGAMLLIGAGTAGAYYRPDLRKRYGDEVPSRSDIVVMSYNVLQFNKLFATEDKTTRSLVAELVAGQNVDILCMQEFRGDGTRSGMAEIDDYMKYGRIVPYYDSDEIDERSAQGLAVFSRYPIIGWGALPPDDNRVYSMWVDVKIDRDTVRVFDNHLHNTTMNHDDVDYISGLRFMQDDTVESSSTSLAGIARKLGGSFRQRAPQAVAVAQEVDESPYPVVLCGDFNDTAASFAYRKVRGPLKDAFVRCGHGSPGTWRGLFNMFRIDFVMLSRELDVKGYFPYDVVYSDHSPVAASFAFADE